MSTGASKGAGDGVPASGWNGGKARIFGGIVGAVLVVDIVTKLLIQRTFRLAQQVELLGDYVRLTYIYNPGAAFGIYLGEYSRIIFLVLSLVALGALLAMYWVTPVRDRVRLTAIALVCAGAIGNLIDRVRSPRGVVDFMDIGIGTTRWPVFNVADVAVTTGAILLAIALVCGGAIGNLIDRVRSPRGVVDFMDIGIGTTRWPVFNVADVAVTTGAILLAISLWREEHAAGTDPGGRPRGVRDRG